MISKKTINNAQSQLESFGEIKVVYYQNRNYETGGDVITLKSIAELTEFVGFRLGQNDDYAVHHATFYN